MDSRSRWKNKRMFVMYKAKSELKDLIKTHLAEANIGLKPFAKESDEPKQILFRHKNHLLHKLKLIGTIRSL